MASEKKNVNQLILAILRVLLVRWNRMTCKIANLKWMIRGDSRRWVSRCLNGICMPEKERERKKTITFTRSPFWTKWWNTHNHWIQLEADRIWKKRDVVLSKLLSIILPGLPICGWQERERENCKKKSCLMCISLFHGRTKWTSPFLTNEANIFTPMSTWSLNK